MSDKLVNVKVGAVYVEYIVRRYGEGQYDWISNAGESDDLYDSADEAEDAAISYLGG